MEKLYWHIDPGLEQEAENNYRTNYALKLRDRDPLEIIKELTFDGVTPNISINDLERTFDLIENKFLAGKIKGVGLEVGAGPLTFSSVLAKRAGVSKVYGVEICKSIIDVLAPRVTNFILGDKSDKVTAVVGSFDEMELPDESVDFIFDFFSLHHSNDLGITLKECHRILNKDGFILCLDKARPDSYIQEDLDELLNSEYDERYKKQFGLPLGQRLTRGENGEREYRLKDWRVFFKSAGFSRMDYFLLDKISGSGFTKKIKRTISLFPVGIQKNLNNILPKPRYNHKSILEPKNRIYSDLMNVYRKESSLLIAYK